MLAEAAGFDGHLRALEREVEAVKAATESLLRTSRSVLASPSPRLHPPPARRATRARGRGRHRRRF